MKSKVDLGSSKVSTTMNEIQTYTEQLKRDTKYQNSTNNELIQQNRKILDILKKIEMKIDKQLQTHKKNMLATNPHHRPTFNKDQMKVLQEQQTNNAKLLTVLQKDLQTTLARRKLFQQGLEQKVHEKKSLLEGKIIQIKTQIKKLSLEQKSQEKKLASYENLSQADYLKEYVRMQEQLRVYSLKHEKALTRFNKINQQLSISTTQILPQFQIPQEIKNNLDKRQQQQYRQYQSIVKLCGVLTKRNDSEKNKANRIYTEKLKELEKMILTLTQVDRAISMRETEILQGKKNIDMIKMKLSNQEKIDKQLFRLSYGARNTTFNEGQRKKSYSSVRLQGLTSSSQASNTITYQKLTSRVMSFVKLPNNIKI